jgi:chromate reductase
MKIFGICGSIRKDSSNWSLLKALQNDMGNHEWNLMDIAKLPYFEPENQFSENTPHIVKEFREAASAADLIVITTPEYAHGIPGILKNALEWIFCEGTMKKPVTCLIGSGQGEHSRDQLIEVLSTMDFRIGISDTMIVKGLRLNVQIDESIKELIKFR